MDAVSPNVRSQSILLVFLFTFHGALCQTQPDNTAIIVGCTIGGFVFLLLILLATYYFCKPSKRKAPSSKPSSYTNQAYTSKTSSLVGNGKTSSLYDGRGGRDFTQPVPNPQPLQKAPSKMFDHHYQPRIWMTGSQMLNMDRSEGYSHKPNHLDVRDRTTSDPNLYRVNGDVVDRNIMNKKERSAVFSAKSTSNVHMVQRSQSFGEPRRRPAPTPPQPMPPIDAASEVDSEIQHYSTIPSPAKSRPLSTEGTDEKGQKVSSLRVASELALGANPKTVGVQHFAVTRPDGGHDLYAIPLRSQVSVDGGESEGEESVGHRTLTGSQYGAHGKEITSSAFEFLEDYDASMISDAELKARSFRSHNSN